MRMCIFLLLWALGFAVAAEPVEYPLELGSLKTRDGRTYDGVKVLGNDAVGIKIVHDGGTARIPFQKLPQDVSDRFNRDTAAAKAQLEKENWELAAYDRAMDASVAERNAAAEESEPSPTSATPAVGEVGGEDEAVIDPSLEAIPDLDGEATEERIVSIQKYIHRLEDGIQKTEEDIKARLERARKIAAGATYRVSVPNGSSGGSMTEIRVNKSKLSRAAFIQKQAGLQREKINVAGVLIKKAREELKVLQPDAPEEWTEESVAPDGR